MSDESMVDRVWKAIEEEGAYIYEGETANAVFRREARAAIRAMRNLDSTELALIMHEMDDLRGPMRESNSTFRTFWQTAIDKALSD